MRNATVYAASLAFLAAWSGPPARASDPQTRALCETPALRDALLAQQQGQRRRIMEIDLDEACRIRNLPADPVHDTADARPDASHSLAAMDARFSEDGRTIVSASRDETVRVWEADTGRMVRVIRAGSPFQVRGLPSPGIVRSALILDNVGTVATGPDGGPVRLFDIVTGRPGCGIRAKPDTELEGSRTATR